MDYVHWSRAQANRLGHRHEDLLLEGSIVSLTRCRLTESYSDAATPDLTLQLCTAGDYDLTSDAGFGRRHGRRRTGGLIVAPANQELALSGGSASGFEITALALRWSDLRQMAEAAAGRVVADFGGAHQGVIYDPALKNVVLGLWTELSSAGRFSRLFADGAVQSLLAAFLRLAETPAAAITGGLSPRQLRAVTDLMLARLDEELTLEELAATAGLSPFHFSRAFRASTGAPPHRRHVELRMERAKQLLAEGALSVIEIALAVGFQSSQAFSRAFHKVVGASPTHYRRRL